VLCQTVSATPAALAPAPSASITVKPATAVNDARPTFAIIGCPPFFEAHRVSAVRLFFHRSSEYSWMPIDMSTLNLVQQVKLNSPINSRPRRSLRAKEPTLEFRAGQFTIRMGGGGGP
jgi:hypothetical protein